MFKKLKVELVLINLILTSIVLITIFSGIYILMDRSFERSSYAKMAKTAEMESIPPFTPRNRNMNPMESFYVKTDDMGNIIEVSQNSSLDKDAYETMLKDILKSNDSRGNVNYKNYSLRYLKVPKHYGFMVVFLERTSDNEILHQLIIISIIVCIISLVLVFIISLFLANVSLKPIIDAWKKQQAFVADASHELRTPLAVITTNLDIVLGNRSETVEDQSKWLGNIKLETTRMTKLIEDLLYLARSDSYQKALIFSRFDLSSAVTQSIIPFEAVAIKQGISMTSNIEPGINFSGNEGRIKQLMAILIHNAIKHTPSGKSIRVNLCRLKNKIQITVQDTGEGIAPEHINKIFDRFYKVDKVRTRASGNFGLGLSIGKSIVREHHGNISVSSTLGKGSTFKVILPC
ncbi:sensor histidine kinase [Clostridium luticellarii]|jgi:signal transduction histidine kinase|uniref:histidine kinase n=1 Tax=Clostridium luticellarii TaxID=1691940 RepID=A0A2T0BSI6_9CLOT|nr:ATP-binding protein [Clostridium luticellarii]MCI1945643.1 HAMP domain-containing histidine kinase [Clostridium luticellarii]MCI1968460.1 HAMP domain-containing histidine kinase [Clostridium luticellarii]PRR86851.1 Phosphate regulon sensor protein PhoR [Clostridium luticellarii]